MTDPYAALRQCVEALERALPIVQYDAQMMADITRHAPLPPEDQAKHDSTEYDSEKLVREIPALITAARAALDARQEPVGWVPTSELHAMQTGYSQSVNMRSSRLTATSAYRPQDVVTLYVAARAALKTQRPVRLTDEQIDAIGLTFDWTKMPIAAFGRAIERAHGIGDSNE